MPVMLWAQTPSVFSGLLTNATDYTSTWGTWYTTNGSGVPSNYFGPAFGAGLADPNYLSTSNLPPAATDCGGTCIHGSEVDYSKVSPWSADMKYFATPNTGGWIYLYDATTKPYTFIRRIQISATTNAFAANANDLATDFSDYQWSRTAGTHVMFYAGSPTTGTGRTVLKAYNPDTDTSTNIHDFTTLLATYGAQQMDNFREGEYSDNDDYFPFAGEDGSSNQVAALIYRKSTNTVVSKALTGAGNLCTYTAAGDCANTMNYITVSPGCGGSTPYMLINWDAGDHDHDWSPGEGMDLFDINMNYLGGVTSNNNHADPGCDLDNNDILVQSADQYAVNYQFHMFAVAKLSVCTSNTVVGPVSAGGCQHFFRMPSTFCWCTGMTISGRATGLPGYFLVSNYDNNTAYNNGETPFSTENDAIQVEWSALSDDNLSDQVAGSPNPYWRLGRGHTIHAAPDNSGNDGDYFAQTNGVPNMNFTAFAYSTTYDHCNVAPCAIPTSELPASGQGQYGALYTMLPITPPTFTLFGGHVRLSGHIQF